MILVVNSRTLTDQELIEIGKAFVVYYAIHQAPESRDSRKSISRSATSGKEANTSGNPRNHTNRRKSVGEKCLSWSSSLRDLAMGGSRLMIRRFGKSASQSPQFNLKRGFTALVELDIGPACNTGVSFPASLLSWSSGLVRSFRDMIGDCSRGNGLQSYPRCVNHHSLCLGANLVKSE